MHEEAPAITAVMVAESDRLSTLPRFLGRRHLVRGEALVFRWMSALSKDYSGGFWNFFTLSNGGFYMAPSATARLRIEVYGNYFQEEMSADAAGIVATMFTLGQLAAETEADRHIDLYHQLRAFAAEHAEAGLILAAID